MPTYLRTFYLQKLIKTKKEEEKQNKKSSKGGSEINRAGISR